MFSSTRFRRAALALALLSALPAAQADERIEIDRLYRAGEVAQALQRSQRAVAAAPMDAALRFQQGVMLAEQQRRAEAAQVYVGLTQDFPELPEPYNNLAVLYAAAGELDKAREALETALRNDPSYATAQENLGDVYLRLALRAYERAGTRNAEAARKLQLARQLAPLPTTPTGAGPRTTP